MSNVNIYRVRFTQSQRYAVNISAPSAELAEFFAEEIRKKGRCWALRGYRRAIQQRLAFRGNLLVEYARPPRRCRECA
jgi:hypothetical protein